MEEKAPVPSDPWWRRPIWLGALGLLLMVGGWKLSTLSSLTPREVDQQRLLSEVRGMAEDQDLRARLDAMERHARREPPYQTPGRLAFFAGLALVVTAGVLMVRQPAARPTEETAETGRE